MKRAALYLIPALLSFCLHLPAELPPELRSEAETAVNKGVRWLKTQQKKDGNFGLKMAPAMTGLAVTALALSGEEQSDEVKQAVEWILTQVQEDGGIYAKGLGGRHIYNTAICLTALHYTGKAEVQETMLGARKFLAGAQIQGEGPSAGGFSYEAGKKKSRADLSNTARAMEAMALTVALEDLREGESAKMDRKAAADYVSSLQHLEGSNEAAWVDASEKNRGGFVYETPKTRGDGTLSRRETKKLATYGTMTYAGVLSLIYADVEKSDLRVQAAMEWAGRNWSLEENPGKGEEGYYYFLNILAKCLQAHGDELITLEDGTQVTWREELLRKLIDLQRAEGEEMGYWKNDNNRYWEGNPMLVTSYILTAMQMALAE